MAEKKKKLNKGLDAIFGGDITSLIDDIEHNTPESSQEKIKLDEIRPNPYQPRKVFDEQALNELALSIQEHGIFQPVILKKSVQGYEIVAGERRCRAARMAHLEEVPAIDGNCFIRKYSKRRFKCHRRSTSLSNDDGKT